MEAIISPRAMRKKQARDRQFSASIKKEVKEVIRSRRFALYVGLAVGFVAFTFLVLLIIKVLSSTGVIEAGSVIGLMFDLTYSASTSIFMMFMSTYFFIVIIILLRDILSKEIKDKKWVLPMQAGIKPRGIMMTRFLVTIGAVVLSVLIACLVHFGLTMAICKKGSPLPDFGSLTNGTIPTSSYGSIIGDMFYSYGMLLITVAFFTLVTCALNAIIKKPAWTVIIALIVVIVLPIVFGVIKVGAVQGYTNDLTNPTDGKGWDLINENIKNAIKNGSLDQNIYNLIPDWFLKAYNINSIEDLYALSVNRGTGKQIVDLFTNIIYMSGGGTYEQVAITQTLSAFSPFLFMNELSSKFAFGAGGMNNLGGDSAAVLQPLHWGIASASTVVVSGALVTGAIFSNKIKAERN